MPTASASHPSNTLPIGVFDSGVGGLSVYLHLQQLLRNEQFIYYADSANVPYGNKSSAQIRDLTVAAAAWLIARGIKLLVIACNSASAHALDILRERYSIPIVGLVPALKPAILLTTTRHIAVLATQATLDGNLLNTIIDNEATPLGIRVHKHFEPALVPWVELGAPKQHPTYHALGRLMQQFATQHIDTVVLGCTHYPFFKQLLQNYIDTHNLPIALVDSGLAIARRVQYLLTALHLNTPTPLNANGTSPPLQFYASRQDSTLVAETLIPNKLHIVS